MSHWIKCHVNLSWIFYQFKYHISRLRLWKLVHTRSAEGAKPESNKRWKTGSDHVCLHVCMYVFSRISHDLEHLANPKWYHAVAPWIVGTLHRHGIIRVRFLTSARNVKISFILMSFEYHNDVINLTYDVIGVIQHNLWALYARNI